MKVLEKVNLHRIFYKNTKRKQVFKKIAKFHFKFLIPYLTYHHFQANELQGIANALSHPLISILMRACSLICKQLACCRFLGRLQTLLFLLKYKQIHVYFYE